MSTRIFRHRYDAADGQHYFIVYPTWIDRGVVSVADLVDSEVVINGREFTGIGAGEFVDGTRPGVNALLPNRAGETLAAFRTNFLGSSLSGGVEIGTPGSSVNEPYDAADYQNMFLSGRDSDGNIIPSFHRQKLFEYIHTNGTAAQREFASFRPMLGRGANNEFTNVYNTQANNPNHWRNNAFGEDVEDDLDVDTDGDGFRDSVWICLLYTSPSPRDATLSRMPSSA